MPVYNISLDVNPNSCVIKTEKVRFRALVESGAEVCLMHRLKEKQKLQKKKVALQSVNGENLNVDVCINLNYRIGGSELNLRFFVVRQMNRNLILGSDWLLNNGIRIYND